MTKEAIKQVALNLFAEKGYDGAVLSEIAGQVGIKTPSIYGHFPSKEKLFLEIWQDLLADYRIFMDNLIKSAAGASIEDQIFNLISGYGLYFEEQPQKYNLWARMLMFAPPEFKEQIVNDSAAVELDILAHAGKLLSQGVEQGKVNNAPLEDLMAAFTVLKEGYVQWLMFYGPVQSKEQTRRIWPLLWRGLDAEDK